MAKFFIKLSIVIRRLVGLPVILSAAETAVVMGVKSRDITNAIKNNQLIPGSHFFLINKEIRFHVTDDLFKAIMNDCRIAAQRAQKAPDNNNPGSNTLSRRRKADYPTTAQPEKKAA